MENHIIIRELKSGKFALLVLDCGEKGVDFPRLCRAKRIIGEHDTKKEAREVRRKIEDGQVLPQIFTENKEKEITPRDTITITGPPIGFEHVPAERLKALVGLILPAERKTLMVTFSLMGKAQDGGCFYVRIKDIVDSFKKRGQKGEADFWEKLTLEEGKKHLCFSRFSCKIVTEGR